MVMNIFLSILGFIVIIYSVYGIIEKIKEIKKRHS